MTAKTTATNYNHYYITMTLLLTKLHTLCQYTGVDYT